MHKLHPYDKSAAPWGLVSSKRNEELFAICQLWIILPAAQYESGLLPRVKLHTRRKD
jgi:hypothetical protein